MNSFRSINVQMKIVDIVFKRFTYMYIQYAKEYFNYSITVYIRSTLIANSKGETRPDFSKVGNRVFTTVPL